MSEQLSIRNLKASYGDGTVVEDVSLDIASGQVVCIVGESGSGKSTLLKCIHGMDRARVTGGEILFHGRDLLRMSARERRRLMGVEIGVIPQNPGSSFNPVRRFRVQLEEMMKSHRLPYDEIKIAETFRRMGLEDPDKILNARPFEMSGGMNQRIAIAAAMLLNPKILLCDEVTSALDVSTAETVIRELKEVNRDRGTTVIMVTHHLGTARQLADRIGIMKDGRLLEYGPADRILYHSENAYTRQLMADMPKLTGAAADLEK